MTTMNITNADTTEFHYMTAYALGYNAFKNGGACIPAQNAELCALLEKHQGWDDQAVQARFDIFGYFKEGVNKASAEWEKEFFANAE